MCSDGHGEALAPVDSIPLGAAWTGQVIDLEPVDSVSITTVCDNSVDIFLADVGPARRMRASSLLGPDQAHLPAPTLADGSVIDSPLAQHGFSAHLVVAKGPRRHTFLFDTGITPTGCVDNLRRLGLDPGDIEAIVCSHGHFDHTTGLSGLSRDLGSASLPVVIHPHFWARRRIAVPGATPSELPSTSRRALEEGGFAVIEGRQPSFLFERSVLVTGEVDRTNGFETGFDFHEAWRDGAWQPDPLILDDQAVVINVAGKGLVVLTGCGHAGVINIVNYARRLTGVDRVYAVIGGFHLSGARFEPRIGQTCDALAAIAPEVVVPAHCTGWKATHALAARLPDAFIQSSVGTRFELASSP